MIKFFDDKSRDQLSIFADLATY